jgi:methionyl aminopeptidase
MSVEPRTPEELELMRQSGRITAIALKKTMEAVTVGITLQEVDAVAENIMRSLGASASFKTVQGYYWATCLNINDEVVHGIPRDIALKKGDILKIDLGAVYKGWHTDTAWTVVVGGEADQRTMEFLKVGEKGMWNAIERAVEGNTIGDVSFQMQNTVEKSGFNVVRELVGHGIGREGHEDPEIPCYGKPGTGIKLKAGMTIAIENIYVAGDYKLYTMEDGWTIATQDGSNAGLFEMTVIVGKDKPEVITDWRKI